ncbi:hypothetical protein AB3S75_022361 [Citrus x aurantiifolia]
MEAECRLAGAMHHSRLVTGDLMLPAALLIKSSDMNQCYASHYWWNEVRFWELDSNQRRRYQNVRRHHMVYDYCSDTHRYPRPPTECQYS